MKYAARCTLIALCCAAGNIAAQEAPPRTSAHVIGIGGANHLDTYLSPLNYTGPQFHYLHESLRPTSLFDGKVSFQSITHVEGSVTKNRPEKADDLGGSLSFDAAWHYHLLTDRPLEGFRLMLGPQIGGTLGFLYNTRNGNNPAQATAEVHLSASVAALYGFHRWGHRFTLREQLDLPLLGAMFSPAYGQSYYELFSLGHTDHNVRLTTPFNAPSLRSLLTFDFPVRNNTFRIGYLAEIRQSHINHIKRHSYTHAVLIGWVRHFTLLPHRQAMSRGCVF